MVKYLGKYRLIDYIVLYNSFGTFWEAFTKKHLNTRVYILQNVLGGGGNMFAEEKNEQGRSEKKKEKERK